MRHNTRQRQVPLIAEPNARFQARPEAAARDERRLLGVACKPLFGNAFGRDCTY